MMVYIIGITGVGKSSLGKHLAKKMGFGFIDLDAWIEVREKKSVGQIFKMGEAHFRDCETAALKSIPQSRSLIIATGGGIVTRKVNIRYMRRHGFVIHLVRPVNKILKSINIIRRPLLKDNPGVLYDLYKKRRKAYVDARHIWVDCTNRNRALQRMEMETKKRNKQQTVSKNDL